MKDTLSIGPVPAGEGCSQVGRENYSAESRMECRALINQLRRMHGNEPAGARLRIESNNHDFGTYYDVTCDFNDQNEEAVNYAYKCEALPEKWDDEAKAELKAQGYSFPQEGK